ncbi:MAG TPA: phosphatidate cytidylyltransferase [Rhodobacteraceae bacterium]|nr:phosphatidate cytidylyltransferase [Paracoccaceae bacterium]
MDSYQTNLFTLFSGLAAVLIIASLIGFVLARRQPADSDSNVIENLNARIKAWWVMIAVIGLAFVWGRHGVILLFGYLSFAGLREFIALTNTKRADHLVLAAAFYIVLPLQYFFIWIDWYGMFSIFIPVYAYLLLPIVAVLRGEVKNFLIRVAEVQWALMITVYCVSYVPALLSLDIVGYEGQNILLIAFLVLVVQSSDVLQYVWGKLVGKVKIAPRLSPSKTVEGFAGGVLSATLVGACLWWMTPFGFFQAGLLALVISLMGFFGGLVMSAIKRDRGIKDWGNTIAGHGGFIDRLDSVIFSAPIFFHIVRFYWSV